MNVCRFCGSIFSEAKLPASLVGVGYCSKRCERSATADRFVFSRAANAVVKLTAPPGVGWRFDHNYLYAARQPSIEATAVMLFWLQGFDPVNRGELKPKTIELRDPGGREFYVWMADAGEFQPMPRITINLQAQRRLTNYPTIVWFTDGVVKGDDLLPYFAYFGESSIWSDFSA